MMDFRNLVIDLHKSAANSNLVPQKIMVTKNGKTFQQTFWIDPNADPNSNSYKSKKLEHHLSNGNRDEAVQVAKELGISWNEHKHPGINWMRASMAMKKYLSQQSGSTQPQSGSTQPSHSPVQPTQSLAQHDNKFSLKTFEALKNDKAEAMKYLKQVGITWQEHSHEGVNWMRATMAAKKAATNSGQSQQPQPQSKPQSQSKPQLQSKPQSQVVKPETKVQESTESPKVDANSELKKTPRQEKIEKLLDGLSEKARDQALKSGMIAGDVEAQAYLDQLFETYTKLSNNVKYQKMLTSKFAITREAAGGIINRMLLDNMKKEYVDVLTKNDDSANSTMVNNLFSSWRYQGANGSPVTSLKLGEQPPLEMPEDFTGLLTVLNKVEEMGGHPKKVMQELVDDIYNVIEVTKTSKEWRGQLNSIQAKMYAKLDEELKEYDERARRDNWEPEIRDRLKDGARNRVNEEFALTCAKKLRSATHGDYMEAKKAIIQKANTNKEYMYALKNLYHMYEFNKNIAKMGWIIPHAYKEITPMDVNEIRKLDNPMTDDEKHDLTVDKAMDVMTLRKDNRKSGKSSDTLKGEMKQQMDKALKEVMEEYGISEEKLLDDGGINCVVSKASSKVAADITQRITSDWDNVNHGGMHPQILGVYEVSDLPVETEYKEIRAANEEKYGKNNTRQFYHGTGSFATTLILGKSGQFKVGPAKVGRMLGNGIYLANKSSKSAQYISDDGMTRHGSIGSLMICEVSLGRVSQDSGSFQADTIEALAGRGKYAFLNNDEWCVRNPKAILPKYLVHLKLL